MAYKVLRSFAGQTSKGVTISFGAGDIIQELPEDGTGADWERAGLIEKIEDPEPVKKSPPKSPGRPRSKGK